MSTVVDQKVVEMQFDNRQFESNVSTSMSTIEKLKQSLNFSGAEKGLDNISSVARGFNLSGMDGAIQTVRASFSGLEVMAITALSNITNTAVNTGRRLTSAFTIDPIKTGFSEYETQINAVQTILANTSMKGTTLDQVNAALDQLNTYADQTIYNFTEMTKNIGTFTAAGIDLDTSVNSIKGIANLAAVSGSTSQQASTAMYQLSQALSSGTVKLQDWNSVVNAGMGGQVFQDALKETAKVHGVAVDRIIKKEGSFRESLKEGWVTSEILTETLAKFTGDLNEEQLKTMGYTDKQIAKILEMGKNANDAATKVKTFTQLFDTLKEAAQSGWTQSWEIIVGDFEEAKKLLTDMSDTLSAMINQSSTTRNNLLQGWKDLGGRTELIKSATNSFNAILAVLAPIKDAFRDIFPPITAKQLMNITKAMESLTEKFKIGDNTSENLKRTFKGFFALLDIGIQAVEAIVKGFFDIVSSILPVGDGLLGITGNLGDFLVSLDDAARSTGIFQSVVGGITDAVKVASDGIAKFVGFIKEKFDFLSKIDVSAIIENFHPLQAIGDFISAVADKVSAAIDKIKPVIKNLVKIAKDAMTNLSKTMAGTFDSSNLNGFTTMIDGGVIAAILISVMKVSKSIETAVSDGEGLVKSLSDIGDGINGLLSSATETLQTMQTKVKGEIIMKIAIAVGILAASLAILSMLEPAKITSSLAAITTMFLELILTIAALNKILGDSKMNGMKKTVAALIGISVAILILSVAMATLGSLDWGGVAKGLVSIASMLLMLVGVTKLFQMVGGDMIKGAGSLIVLAIAIGILSLSVKMLGSMDTTSIMKGIVSLVMVCVSLVAFLNSANLSGIGIKSGIGLMALAAAVFTLSIALKIMATMSFDEMVISLTTFIATLGYLAIAMNAMPGDMLAKGAGLLSVAAALVVIAAALRIMGGMSMESMATGLSAMALSLTILIVAMNLMTATIPGALAMLLVSGAVLALSVALKVLGSMSLPELGISLAALAGGLAIIAGAAYLMTPVIPTIAAVSASLSGFMLALTALVAAIGALNLTSIFAGIAAPFQSLGDMMGIETLKMAVKLIPDLIVGILNSIARIGMAILDGITNLVVGIANVFIKGAPAVGQAILAIVNAIGTVLVGLFEGFLKAIDKLGLGLVKLAAIFAMFGIAALVLQPLVPAIVALSVALVAFGVGCLAISVSILALAGALSVLAASGLLAVKSLTDIYNTISQMGNLAFDAVLKAGDQFIEVGKEAAKNILDGLKSGLSESEEKITTSVKAITSQISSLNSQFSKCGSDIASSFLKSMSESLGNGSSSVVSVLTGSITSMTEACLNVIRNKYSQFTQVGSSMVQNIVNGIDSIKENVSNCIDSICIECSTVMTNYYSKFYSAGVYLASGLASGIRNGESDVISAATEVASSAIDAAKKKLKIHSPSRAFYEIGDYAGQGFINALNDFAYKSKIAGEYLAESSISGLSKSISGIADAASGDVDGQPTIRPILDLSDVENGMSAINTMFSQNEAMKISLDRQNGGVDSVASGTQIIVQMKPTFYGYTPNDGNALVRDLNRKLGGLYRK